MKNIKQLYPILTAIQCINQTNGHRDDDIAKLLEYISIYITNSNYNMITLTCIGRTKEEIMPELNKLLGEETKYLEFIGRRTQQ
ncbi:MAG: hypothetical protein IJ398_04280 [Clostridia bacterium]|nr:hypothetical protein [Clostridia bacterium]